jgi:periplasmic divalent cation tolerance protein
MHSYAVPCIVTLPVTGGHQPFLDWVASETQVPGVPPEGA